MDGQPNADDEPPRTGAGRAATLGAQLRWADAAMARQQDYVAAAREAIAELRALRDETRGDAGNVSDAADSQAELLTRRIEVLERQLETLEHADATARAQALGLRDVNERAGDGLPFRAGPLSGVPNPGDLPGPG